MLSYLGPIRTPKPLFMKKTFTKKTKFLSGVLTLKKKIVLLLIMVIMGTGSLLHAQDVKASGFLYDSLGKDLDGLHLVFVSLTPIDSAEASGTIDADFALAEGEVENWSDCSVMIRFVNKTAPYIDVFDSNIGDFNTEDVTQLIKYHMLYYFWIEVNVPTQTYTVYVDTTKGISDPVKIATDYSFRKKPVSKLDMWSSIHGNPGNFLRVHELKLVETVGEIPGVDPGTDVRTVESVSDLSAYPNPFRDAVEIELDGNFEYGVYDLSGSLILEGISHNKLVIGKGLAQGYYILKVNQNNSSKAVKLIKY